MQEIMHSFSREKAQNAEHVQYMKFLLEEIPQEKAVQFGFILQWDAFSLSVNNEVSGFHPNKAFIETEVIRMYDNKRDKIYLMYKQIIQAIANYHPDEEKKQAGRTLSFVFKQAGRNVHRLSYDSETAILDKVVDKLRHEPYRSALALLEMNQIPDQIEAANQEFQSIYRQRMRTEREKILAADMRKLRSQTDDAFNELAKAINALYRVNEMAAKDETTRLELGKLIDNTNDIIYRFRKIIGNGSSQNSGATTEDKNKAPQTGNETEKAPAETEKIPDRMPVPTA